ncbi:MAG: ATP-dependent Clp protease ATP-binding subunit [Ruminococcaceae bacterium]|nr:ATP-dependent Clp protease ATP-binding subunit [Oscillospiraceae bacterium]
MEMCARCKKRIAVIFISRMEGDKTTNEGICIKCAKELGIGPINNILGNMGITDEDIDRMDMEMEGIMEAQSGDGDEDLGKTPPINFAKLFGSMGKGEGDSKDQGDQTKGKKGKNAKSGTQFLDTYCTDITAKAREGKLDRVIGRDSEMERMMQILCRRQKNNPCLIGEPGVGKTAIAEALAQLIADGKAPRKLADKEVRLVDLTALVAGTQFRGQFESRIKGLIEEVKAKGNVILVIDEVHSIVGAGDSEGSMNAANILKPALSRGDIQMIGATTLAEYRKYIESDSALERRFQPIIVEEPSIDDTIEILRGIKGYYESFHGITIPDMIIARTVILSERYITDRFLPDKAIDLLDEAASHLALHSPEVERAAKAEAELARLTGEVEAEEAKEVAENEDINEKYRRVAELKTALIAAEKEADEAKKAKEGVVLTTSHLASVVELWTGIPASNITENEFKRVDRLADRLKERLIGQDEAVDAVARAIKRNRAGIAYKRKPVSFIFAGPTGVGKTELVKLLAADLFDSPETLIRLDMSEFMEKHSVSRIIGAPPGYVGYDDAGQLTEKIRRKPYSVVLFDEIEKAHPDVMNILLQILDDGHITDARGKKVNFENTVIVMTTNAGAVGVDAPLGFSGENHSSAEGKTEKALAQFLRPEFINRVDEIITFRSLDEDDFIEIAKIMLGDLVKTLAEKEITLTYSEDALRVIARRSFSRKYGARNLRRTIQREVEDVLASKLIGDYDRNISVINMSASGDDLVIVCN